MRQKPERFGNGLSNEKAVKGIVMNAGQAAHGRGVPCGYLQLAKAATFNFSNQFLHVGIELSETGFNCGFPNRCTAHIDFGGVENAGTGFGRQMGMILQPPQV